MVDYADVRRELMARRFALGKAPEGPAGVYAFFVDHPRVIVPLAIQPDGLIYVGMTSPQRGSGARDHVECAHSGGSTLRRSLGALLKERLRPPLQARPRARREDPKNWQHYRFQEEGEAALTKWMKAHLQMNFVVLDASREDIRVCEKALIGELQPPLNLTDWPNPQASQVERLRGLCAQEARGHFMTTTDPPPRRPKKIDVTLQVHNEVEARELHEAWEEIVTGRKLARTGALEHGAEAVMERARTALQTIETAIREHPTTGQAGRLVRFLAGVYNGSDFPFDLTDLRALDTELANACLDYLNYDRLGKREVHHHLSGGDRELHQWLKDYGVEPALRLGERQAQAFAELPEKTGRDRYELLDEAVDDLVDNYRRKLSAPKR